MHVNSENKRDNLFTFALVLFKMKVKPPLFVFRIVLFLFQLFAKVRGVKFDFDFDRFRNSQWIPKNHVPRSLCPTEEKKIDLVFVATQKDFETLKISLPMAIKAIPKFQIGHIKLIVPTDQVSVCRTILGKDSRNLEIIDEDSLIDIKDRNSLFDKFGSRYTWVLQQILKVASVLESESEAILIVDADTVLLNKRNWLNSNETQLLQVSEEYNEDYYEFLANLDIGINPPLYTQVTHHMLLQKKYLIEALGTLGVRTVHELVELIKDRSTVKSNSSICVDYELYGQYMMMKHRDKICLDRWCNVGISSRYFSYITRSSLRLRIMSFFFHSASFHSWS